jgi:hypothetical protein
MSTWPVRAQRKAVGAQRVTVPRGQPAADDCRAILLSAGKVAGSRDCDFEEGPVEICTLVEEIAPPEDEVPQIGAECYNSWGVVGK